MKYRTFLESLNTAYVHRGGLKTLVLGHLSEAWFGQIQADCRQIIDGAKPSDVGNKQHVTNWTRPTGEVRQFSLFNTSGHTNDTAGDYGYAGDVKAKRLAFPELKGLTRFAGLFIPDLRNLRLNGMGSHSALNAHEEGSIIATRVGTQHILRFHLPIWTNPSAQMFLDDEWFHYEEGKLYFFHHGCVHAATNCGDQPRYHLVLDCFLSKGLFKRLFPGQYSTDSGFRKPLDYAEATLSPVGLNSFPNFAREGGDLISGSIDYGRSVPRWSDWYRENYPSLFRNS